MATTDEDLQALQNEVEGLREKVAAENDKRLEREHSLANDVQASQLSAERSRLEAQLAEAKKYNTASVVKEGASGVLEAAKEEQKRAEAQLKATEAQAKADSSTDK